MSWPSSRAMAASSPAARAMGKGFRLLPTKAMNEAMGWGMTVNHCKLQFRGTKSGDSFIFINECCANN